MKELISQLNKLTQVLLGISLVFIIYGYLCRAIGLYFFWESESVGWFLFFAGIISLLLDRVGLKQAKRQKVTLERIGIGVAGFVLFIQTILLVIFHLSDAYAVVKSNLLASKTLAIEIGTVNGFSLNPSGEINTMTDSRGEHGNAVIHLIAKGDRRLKDVTVYVVKRAEKSKWEVERVE